MRINSVVKKTEMLNWGVRQSDHVKRVACVFMAGLAFALVILKINHALFVKPINEYSDFATNTLQIQEAKRFHSLLGNFSRWGFHHPGPVFFYIFAVGEAVLHDWLRIAPEAMNAQLITIIVLNIVFLFSAIAIVAQYCQSRLFIPLAVASAIYFIYMVNRVDLGSAFVSIWMPHVLLFCFLLFATASASVAAGRFDQLPILAFSGLVLIHGHVAQPVFVLPLAGLASLAVLLPQAKQKRLKAFLRINRIHFIVSGLLVVVFAAPVLLEAVVYNPNNFHHIHAYMKAYRGLQNSPAQALKYEASFLMFHDDSTAATQAGWANFLARGGSRTNVVIYWCLWCCLVGVAMGRLIYARAPVPLFLKYLGIEIILLLLLFFYWSMRMTGIMFNFNGFFFYAIPLLVCFGLLAFLLDGVKRAVGWPLVTVASCLVPLLMLGGKSYFRNVETGWEETDRLIASLPANLGPVNVTVPTSDWLELGGVISHMKRKGYQVCIADTWGVLIDLSLECQHITGLQNLILARAPRPCEAPCQTLEADSKYVVQLTSYPWLRLPFQINKDSIVSVNDNFHTEAGGLLATRKSTIRFLLAADMEKHKLVLLRITGVGVPGHPAEIVLNGEYLGTLEVNAWQQETSSFNVDAGMLRPGQENDLTFIVRKAEPIGRDWRDIGYIVKKVEFDVANNKDAQHKLKSTE